MYYRRQLGEDAEAQAAQERAFKLQPANARDHYLLATTYLRNGGPDSRSRALEELNHSLRLNPQHYWAWFQRGLCHQQAADYHLAAADFGTCIGLWPDFAWGYFNLGYAHDRSGRKEEAIRSYTAALEHDPDFADAYLNRGLACLELQRYEQALADFTRAVALQKDDAALYAGRGLALAGMSRHREADDAFREAFARLPAASEAVQKRIRCGYGFAVCERAPEEARAAFEAILQGDPQHPEALYGRALVAVGQGHTEEAIGFLDRAIAAAPQLMEARRHRAIQLARCGRFAEAFQAINWCLEREPQVGATLYAAACVAARAAERSRGTTSDAAAAEKAITLLQQAIAQGYGREQAAQDPDLTGVRDHPEFRRLLGDTPGVVQITHGR
jgi:tetratricopeptide (TPR) repeat protein